MRWRCAPGDALRERAGPDAEVMSGAIILRSAIGVAPEDFGYVPKC